MFVKVAFGYFPENLRLIFGNIFCLSVCRVCQDSKNKMAESSLTKSNSNSVPLKVVLLGVKDVGKTSLFLRIKEDKFYSNTNGKNTDSFTHSITVNGRTAQMYLWDTAGMEGQKHERTLTRSYYLGSQVALLVYSADDWDSVVDLEDYVNEIHNHAPGAKKFLVRNKVDLDEQAVIKKDVDDMFKKHGYQFLPEWKFNTSASTGEGIQTLLEEIGKVLLRQGSLKPDEKNSFQIYKQKQNSSSNSKSSSCC